MLHYLRVLERMMVWHGSVHSRCGVLSMVLDDLRVVPRVEEARALDIARLLFPECSDPLLPLSLLLVRLVLVRLAAARQVGRLPLLSRRRPLFLLRLLDARNPASNLGYLLRDLFQPL